MNVKCKRETKKLEIHFYMIQLFFVCVYLRDFRLKSKILLITLPLLSFPFQPKKLNIFKIFI